MKLSGKHTISVSTLKELREELDKLPESVLSSAVVTEATADSDRVYGYAGTYVEYNHITLELEWPVELS